MSRFIVFSDLHLNSWKYGSYSTYKRLNSRLDGQLRFLEDMCTYANEHEIKDILFCGDFFHTSGHVKAEVLQGAYKTIKKATKDDIFFYWIAGNHDQADKLGSTITTDFLAEFGTFVGPKTATPCPRLGVNIIGCDYTERRAPLEVAFETAERHPGSLLLLHQGVSGVEINSRGFSLNESLKPGMIPHNVLHAYAGHYHSYKRVSEKLTIPGAPMQFNWGDESEDRGFLDVEILGPELHTKLVPGRGQEFKKIKYDPVLELSDYHALVYENSPHVCFVKVTHVPSDGTSGEQVKEHIMRYGISAVELEYIESTIVTEGTENFESFDKLFEEYVKANDITGRQLEVGKSILSAAYEPGVDLDAPDTA